MFRPLVLGAVLLAALPARAASTDDHRLVTAAHPAGKTLIKVVEPEGAAVEIFEGKKRLFEDDVPCSFEAKGDRYYRLSVRKGDKVWEKKIATRSGEVSTLQVFFTPEPPAGPPRPAPMADKDFKELLLAVEGTRVYKDKVQMVRATAQKSYFEASQVGRIIDLTPLSMDKLEMLRALKKRIVDPENTFKIYVHLRLDDDKRRARAILEPQ